MTTARHLSTTMPLVRKPLDANGLLEAVGRLLDD